jgi:hypothetical protein
MAPIPSSTLGACAECGVSGCAMHLCADGERRWLCGECIYADEFPTQAAPYLNAARRLEQARSARVGTTAAG